MNKMKFSTALGAIDDKYILEAATWQKAKKSPWAAWGMMAACFTLVFTVTMFKLPGFLGGDRVDLPEPTVTGNGEQLGVALPQLFEGQNVVIHWDKVNVNELEGMTSDATRLYLDPALYEEEIWGQEEIKAYYGWELSAPYVPDGLTGGGKAVTAKVYRDKATGELIEDQVGRGFWVDFYEDGSPKSDDDIVIPTGFTITVSKLGIVHCGILPEDNTRTTDFGGVSVTLTHSALPYGPFDPTQKDPSGLYNLPAGYYDIYQAAFERDGVEYEITAQRMELEELVKIVASVVDPEAETVFVGK